MYCVEPDGVTGYFKMIKTTGAQWMSPGRMPRTGVNRGDAVAIPAHFRNVHVSTGPLP